MQIVSVFLEIALRKEMKVALVAGETQAIGSLTGGQFVIEMGLHRLK